MGLVIPSRTSAIFHFNPPTPWGVGLPRGRQMPARALFQSTHSVGSGTLACLLRSLSRRISIHPLRGEWDSAKKFILDALQISIHPLRGEWDGRCQGVRTMQSRFQSTHSVGSGTAAVVTVLTAQGISIHPLRGEWDWSKCV